MIIKIDTKLLDKQIALCDTYGFGTSTRKSRELYEGIANLLSEVGWAAERKESILFIKAED